jgi:SAM-dependent methyltransferase
MELATLLRRVGRYESVTDLHVQGHVWVDQLEAAGELKTGAGQSLLDYGAGLGRLSVPLTRRGYSVVAVDECPHMRRCLTGGGVTVYPPGVLDVVTSGLQFDVAFCCYVLQHNPPSMVRTIIDRIGQHADRLLFTVPTRDDADMPLGFVPPSMVPDVVSGEREALSAMYRTTDVPLLFTDTVWDVATLEKLPIGGGLWAINRRAD